MIFFLIIFWFLLSEQFTSAFIIFAFLSIAAIVFIDKKLFSNSSWIIGFKVSWMFFVFKIIKEIVISTLQVSKIIWFKSAYIKPKTFWVEANFRNKINIITFANSITLTPGTMTLDIQENKVLIHSLANEMDDLDKINTLVNQVDK